MNTPLCTVQLQPHHLFHRLPSQVPRVACLLVANNVSVDDIDFTSPIPRKRQEFKKDVLWDYMQFTFQRQQVHEMLQDACSNKNSSLPQSKPRGGQSEEILFFESIDCTKS